MFALSTRICLEPERGVILWPRREDLLEEKSNSLSVVVNVDSGFGVSARGVLRATGVVVVAASLRAGCVLGAILGVTGAFPAPRAAAALS